MKAMLLAAGLGKRLRPLTEATPKPLLQVGARSLIEYQIENLVRAGITDIVINLHHLGHQIQALLGDGRAHGVQIEYSIEPELLETGGGIRKALPLLGEDPFVVVSADTYIEFDFGKLPRALPAGCLGCLLMTQNPAHHPDGDFAIDAAGVLLAEGDCLTYTGTAVLSPDLVSGEPDGPFALRKVFDAAIAAGRMRGLRHDGYWCDVGTLERLEAVQAYIE
jgi:MurNAc alpha-1-phosphate uridylyltransferase